MSAPQKLIGFVVGLVMVFAVSFGIGSAIYKPGDSAAVVAGKARLLMDTLMDAVGSA